MTIQKNLISKSIPNAIRYAIIIFFILQLTISSFLIYFLLINENKSDLTTLSNRIVNDIRYTNGKWDLSAYNSDPQVPEVFPLYIITLDGFILDRNTPIHGFLDKSRITLLNNYLTPQTVHTVTNEKWRLYSKPIMDHGAVIGIISDSLVESDDQNVKQIDKTLENTADKIYSEVSIQHGKIITSSVSTRNINYKVTIEIVDQFNTILFKSGNINSINQFPDYIDRSYVGYDLSLPSYMQVKDSLTNEPYLIYNNTIKDKNHNTVGLIVTGRPIDYIYQTIENFILIDGVIGLLLISLLLFYISETEKIFIGKLLKGSESTLPVIKKAAKISFLKKESQLLINDTTIAIPFSTNQYYFCEALFSNPKKRWEADELLEKFGEHDLTKWHKVYDAMKTMNTRVNHYLPEKLFILKNKTYQINPLFHKVIS